MRENGIRARHKRRFKATTDSRQALPVAANLLDRNFTPAAPDRVWTADMTDIWTDEGWLSLAVVPDLFHREVVGWSIKPGMTADLVVDALTLAGFRRKPQRGGSIIPAAAASRRATPFRRGWKSTGGSARCAARGTAGTRRRAGAASTA